MKLNAQPLKRENMKRQIILILLLLEAAIFLFFSMNIQGRLLIYEKSDDTIHSGSDYFTIIAKYDLLMTDSVIDDVLKYPEKYTAYRIKIHLRNASLVTAYGLEAALHQNYNNLWFDRNAFDVLDLKPGEAYDGNVQVIVKTENMRQADIDQLIKSLKIDISASYFTCEFFIRSSKTISFK